MYNFDESAIRGRTQEGFIILDPIDVMRSREYNPQYPGGSVAFPGMRSPEPPAPKSDISQMSGPGPGDDQGPPLQQIDPNEPAPNYATAQQTLGEQAKPTKLQPGNRRSIKEYLAEIHELQRQQRAAGVPEDQLAVPSFTNIQGGPMDKSQGNLAGTYGAMGELSPGKDVRSYVEPEYVQGPGGAGDIRMGPTHRVTQGMNAMAGGQGSPDDLRNVTNPLDPRAPMANALKRLPQLIQEAEQVTGSQLSPQQIEALANEVAKLEFATQGELVAKRRKDFPGADYQALFNAYEKGNWAYAQDAAQNLLSQEKIGKVAEEYIKKWDKSQEEMTVPVNEDTGEPFKSQEDFVSYKVQKYQETVQQLLQVMQEQNQPTNDAQAGGGQTPPASALKEGMVTEFKNGQKWTLKQGKPERVK